MYNFFNRNTLRSLPKKDLLALECSIEFAKRNLRFEFPPSYSVKPKSIDFTGFDVFYLPRKQSRE